MVLWKRIENAIGLWRHRFCFGVINIINRQIQLITVLINPATILRSTVSQNAQHGEFFLLENGNTLSLSTSATVMGVLVV